MVVKESTNRDAGHVAGSNGEASWVQKTAGVCGGDACIRNTRITVHGLIHYRQLGLSDAEILSAINGLTVADLQAASEYYLQHGAEIEEAIRANEEAE